MGAELWGRMILSTFSSLLVLAVAMFATACATREVPVASAPTRETLVTVEVTLEVPVTNEVPVTRQVAATVVVERNVIVTRKVPATVEMDRLVTVVVPETVEVEVTRENPVPIEVEATREVFITREVAATVEVEKVVEQPLEIPVTREVEVTREVPVTRVVRVPAPPPTPESMPDLRNSPRLVFGPLNSTIELNKHDGYIDDQPTGVNIQNLRVEAEFGNPYPTYHGRWSYGFLVRYMGRERFHDVIINSDGRMDHMIRTGSLESEEQLLKLETFLIDTSYPATNRLTSVITRERCDVFINEQFATQLDMSRMLDTGDVFIVGSYWECDAIDGAFVEYSDFGVWALERR